MLGASSNLNVAVSYHLRETEDAEKEVEDFLISKGLFVVKLNWNTITPKIAGLISIICNVPVEKIFNNGIPDFFVASGRMDVQFAPSLIEKDVGRNINYTFIEVKKESDSLSANQLNWMAAHPDLKIELWYLYKNLPQDI